MLVLLAGWCAVILYGTLSPFNFTLPQKRSGAFPHRRIEWIPFTFAYPEYRAWYRRDKARNLALFVPFGLLVAVAWPRNRSLVQRIGAVTAAGFSLSLAIELTQIFLPSRYPGASDLLMNTTGACLGAALASVLGHRKGEGMKLQT